MSSTSRQSYTLYIGSADGIIWTRSRWKMFPNLYVKVEMEGSAVQRTMVIKGSRAPAWKENIIINGDMSSIISLSINHSNTWLFIGDPCIGSVNISIGTLLDRCADGKTSTVKVNSPTSKERDMSIGEITVKLSLVDGVGDQLAGDLCGLGRSQLTRFERLGEQTDLEDCFLNCQKAVQLTEDGYPDKPEYLASLGRTQRARFVRLGELTDLEDSISNFQKAVQFTDDGHPYKPEYLFNLGSNQEDRFRHHGELADLEDWISNLHRAVELTDDGNPDKAIYLSSLGSGQQVRFKRLRELTDIEDSISNYHKAVQLTDDGQPEKPMRLANLGIGYIFRSHRLGQLTDLEDGISNLDRAIQFTDDGHPTKVSYLFMLGMSQLDRFFRLGELADIDDCISNFQKAAQFTDDGDPFKPESLCLLGSSLLERFKRLGQLTDIEDSIMNFSKVVQFTHDGHPSKASYLSSLGLSQHHRFELLGELVDLEDCISNSHRAVRLTGNGDPERAEFLGNLGSSQHSRFKLLGELADLEDSISHSRRAVQLTDDSHPERAGYLSNLGCIQYSRFKCLGEVTDIDDSVSNLHKAVQLIEDGHPRKPTYLSNLGASQTARFKRLGELTDLEDSFSNIHRAVQLVDDRDPRKGLLLCNLGHKQQDRFKHLGELADLENSISNAHRAVQLADDNLRHKALCLSLLGRSQLNRFDHIGELTDLEESISNFHRAVQFTGDGDSYKALHLENLGIGHKVRFYHLGELTDLEDSISNFHRAIHFADDGHPDKAKYLLSLGDCQMDHFELLGQPAARVASISAFKTAAQSKTAYPRDALLAAQKWAHLSYHFDDIPSALDGYRTALEILPMLAWLGLSTLPRQKSLFDADSEQLSCLAVTCAVQQGRLEEAVELLDLGRSLFWQQALSLRVELETLKEIEPELAAQLERVGHKLDTDNFSGLLPAEKEIGGVNSTEDVGKERRRLVGEWEGLLGRVRQLPHYEHFLRPAPFCQLRRAAAGGHVIIINVSRYGVDALIFDDAHQIVHVPLPNTDFETLRTLALDIMGQRPISASAAQRQGFNNRYLKPALRVIWNDILIPIFDHIQIPRNRNCGPPLRRIWWYPTGPLTVIPIHAASPGKGDIDASRLVISSYVTTLGSFLAQKKTGRGTVTGQLKLLALSQPVTPGQESLPRALEEVEKVVEVVSSAGWSKEDIVNLSGPDATVDRVSEALDSCSWVHFSCHGMQYQKLGMNSMNSAFALQDGDLELRHIASKRLSTGQFAFLSACHTATGMELLPGEAMHLAGGLQFTGFPSVIATMWGICDEDAPIVARHTYEYLFRNGLEGCDPSEAAAALNQAVLRLREDPKVTVDRWAPFVHFGI